MVSSRAVGAIDPVAFLRGTPPFDALPAALFEEASRTLDVAAHRAGERLARTGGAPLEHLYVIRKGAVRLEREGQPLQVVEEGETFGYTSLIAGEATLDVVVEEDLVAYRLPAAAFRRLLSNAPFSSHFAAGLATRLKASLEHAPVAIFRSDLAGAVRQLVRRAPVWVEAGATVADAARLMRDERISSVLVRGDPPGIVTDRDFRNRVLAEDRGPETPIADVTTRPVRCVDERTPIYLAWMRLLDDGVHHLPVTREDAIVGILTSTDLAKHASQGPVAILRGIERLAGPEGLPGYGARVAEMASALVAGRLEVSTVAGFVARLNDALVRRILRWAEDELGPPPAPYAWVAFGSEGRMEQTLLTDQDNALVYADEGEAARGWYAALAARVNAHLEAAGFPRCPGGYMATRWHGPVSEWASRFAGWIDYPQPQALLEASIFFDYRRVAGELPLDPLDAVVASSPGKAAFLRFLARAALEFRPPPSLLLRLRGDASELDLKLQGISPIVFLARCYALECGAPARNTLERLEACARAGGIDREVQENVAEAYRFLLGLRLRLQLAMLAGGRPATNRVALAALSAIERARLKEAFRIVRGWQERASFHFRIGF
jgi:CBS domain-containing protein